MKKLVFKICLAIVIFPIAALALSGIFVPKWVDGNNPQTFQMENFNKLEEHSLDVLVLGSCQSYQGFNPAILWESEGLTSYVLASPDQRIYVSYLYLLYALQTQSPKVVLLDTLMFTEPNTKSHAFDTKAVYSVPDKKFWYDAQKEIFEIHYTGDKMLPQYYVDKAINAIQAVFPVFTFNTTLDLTENWIRYYCGTLDNDTYNGSVPMYVHMDLSKLSNFMQDNSQTEHKLDPIAAEYVEKIVDVCKKNDIQLILYKTLSPSYWSYESNRIVSEYAEALGLEYIDFNMDWEAYGLDLSQHLYALWKLNADGMYITTQYLGDYITSHYGNLFDGRKTETTVVYYNDMSARYNEAYETAIWDVANLSE